MTTINLAGVRLPNRCPECGTEIDSVTAGVRFGRIDPCGCEVPLVYDFREDDCEGSGKL